MLSNMESAPPERPTVAEVSAALTDAEASRATLAHGIATPSWFFASVGAAIATQIATTAVGLGEGAPFGPGGRPGGLRRSGRSAAGAVPEAQRRLARRLRQSRRVSRDPGPQRRRHTPSRSGPRSGRRTTHGGGWWRSARSAAARRTRSAAAGGCAPTARGPRSTGAGNRRRGWPCSPSHGHRGPGAAADHRLMAELDPNGRRAPHD